MSALAASIGKSPKSRPVLRASSPTPQFIGESKAGALVKKGLVRCERGQQMGLVERIDKTDSGVPAHHGEGKAMISAMRSMLPTPGPPHARRSKGVVRVLLLLLAAAMIAAAAAAFGIAHDYGYLHASILTGSPEGQYFALAMRLADRAKREHGILTVIPTAGSIENVSRLAAGRGHCAEMFGLIQDDTPVPGDARLELLGRLPEPESLLLLGRQGHAFHTFADLRGTSVGIGPEGSGTAYLMRQLFADSDLRGLNVHLSHHGLEEQAQLVAEHKLDVAAFVIREDAELAPSSTGTDWILSRRKISRA